MRHVLLCVCLLLTGCAGNIWISEVDPDSGPVRGRDAGVQFHAPAPYVWITTAAATKRDGPSEEPAYAIEVVYLPDPERAYTIRWKPGLFGSVQPKFTLDQGWNLVAFESQINTELNPGVSLQGFAHLSKTAQVTGPNFKGPGLYKLEFDRSKRAWTLGPRALP